MKTILLVDDNAEFRGLIKDMLKFEKTKFKFTVIESSDPIVALEAFYRHNKSIDIVVCDFFMPVQNGNDFLEIIKQNKPGIQCLLVSGDIQIKDRKYEYVDSAFSKLELGELFTYLNK